MSESWFVDGGWACHCGPVPPYPADYPGPCRQCFALAPVKQKSDNVQSVRDAEEAVIAAAIAWAEVEALAYHMKQKQYAEGALVRAVDALAAVRTLRAQEGA